jgi:hypothetical protein
MKNIPLIAALLGSVFVIALQFLSRGSRRTSRDDQPTVPIMPGNTTRVMQIGISVIVLAAGLWVILSGNYGSEQTNWAFGAIGTIIGFWLKG